MRGARDRAEGLLLGHPHPERCGLLEDGRDGLAALPARHGRDAVSDHELTLTPGARHDGCDEFVARRPDGRSWPPRRA